MTPPGSAENSDNRPKGFSLAEVVAKGAGRLTNRSQRHDSADQKALDVGDRMFGQVFIDFGENPGLYVLMDRVA